MPPEPGVAIDAAVPTPGEKAEMHGASGAVAPAALSGSFRSSGSSGSVRSVVARRTARRAIRSGVLWGYVFGLFVASSAWGYTTAYRTGAQRRALAATFGSNAGINAIIGTAHRIQTAAGFTAWRSLGVLGVVGAVWGLLASTRMLRGEEDAGRWELLLAGQTTRRRACAQAMGGLGAGVGVLWALTAAITAVVGRSSKLHFSVGASLFFALAVVSGAAVFLAVGALTSQLTATRRQAAALAGTLLGASFAVRMVADSGSGLQWLRWASPLGWIEELQPLTSPHPLALIPLGGLTALCAGAAALLAGRRDLGSSILPDWGASTRRRALLSGTTGLAVRLLRPTSIGWGLGIGALAATSGLIARSAGDAFASSSFQQAIDRLGGRGSGATAYLGIAFVIVGALVALVAATHVTALRGEEADGRLDHLLAGPVSRWRWLLGRLAVTTGVLVAAALASGLLAWCGAVSQGAEVGSWTLVEAGLNLVPAGLLVLGLGVVVFGVVPRATTVAVYGVVVWSFLVDLIGGIVNANHWLLDTSILHQVAPAPAVAPDWTVGGVMVLLGLVLVAGGGLAFGRRDLVSA